MALDAVKQMAHLFLFGSQIGMRDFVYARLARNSLNDLDPGLFKLAYLFRIVGKQPNLFRAELLQDLRGKVILTRVRSKAELLISLDRVHTAVLQFVCPQLVHQADSTTLLGEIEQDP